MPLHAGIALAIAFALAPIGPAGGVSAVTGNCLTDYCATLLVILSGSGTGTATGAGLSCTYANGASSGTCAKQYLWVKAFPTYTVNVTFTSGLGSIECYGPHCQPELTPDTVPYTLNPGDTFKAEEGFNLAPRQLDITSTGSGSGQVAFDVGASPMVVCDFPGPCLHGTVDGQLVASAVGSYGDPVTLVATPDAGATFGGWTGACAGQKATCHLTLDSAYPKVKVTTNAVFGLPSATAAPTPARTSAPTTRPTSTPTKTAAAPSVEPASIGPAATPGPSITAEATPLSSPAAIVTGTTSGGIDSMLVLAGAILIAGLAIGFGLAFRGRRT